MAARGRLISAFLGIDASQTDTGRRIPLTQTSREDCGERYRKIIAPELKSKKFALDALAAFGEYFTTLAAAKSRKAQIPCRLNYVHKLPPSGGPRLGTFSG